MNGVANLFQSSIDLIGKGGVIMIPICLCSVIALAIIIERLYFFKKSSSNLDGFFKSIEELLQNGEDEKTVDHCRKFPNPLGRLIEVGLSEKQDPRWKLEEKLSMVGQEEVNTLGNNIRGLEVIATISPLMGLLGTVIGMVQAFSKVAQYQGQVDPSLLAGGIWEALLTTAAGLAVAIPTVVMLHYFEGTIARISFQLSKYGQLFLHIIDAQLQQGDPSVILLDYKKQPGLVTKFG
jgi:biopolymer transport protein ExbB